MRVMLGEVIMRDQALMANIIKIANSPAYHTLTSVKTPTHAVAIIGFDIIRSIVVAAHSSWSKAEEYGANTECLKRLLARSLVAATESVELGKAIQLSRYGLSLHQCHAVYPGGFDSRHLSAGPC